jgi:hypothetical protein
MLIGISQGGFIGCLADPEMNQFAQTTGQPIADLAQEVSVRQLAEQHRHQLCPATEALGCPFRSVLLHQRGELQAREVLKQLIEQAHCLYPCVALLLEIRRPNGPAKDSSPPEQL